jgi:hypothetical protein
VLIGRTQTNGKADYDDVHKFQDGIKAVPLSAYGRPYGPPTGAVNANQDMSAPPDQVDKMDAARAKPKTSSVRKSGANISYRYDATLPGACFARREASAKAVGQRARSEAGKRAGSRARMQSTICSATETAGTWVGMKALLLEDDLIRKPASTFRDHART